MPIRVQRHNFEELATVTFRVRRGRLRLHRTEAKDYDYRNEPFWQKNKHTINAADIVDDAMDGLFDDILNPDPQIRYNMGLEIYKNLPEELPVITVKNPWADCLVRGFKDIENRGWNTGHRGPVVIHSSKTPDKAGFRGADYEIKKNYLASALSYYNNGYLIGMVNIIDVIKQSDSIWADGFSKYYWVIRDAIMFPSPIVAKGKLGFWTYKDDQRLLRDQIRV